MDREITHRFVWCRRKNQGKGFNMKKCVLGIASLLLFAFFAACDDTASANSEAAPNYASRVDTLYVSSRDTLVVSKRDTLWLVDTTVRRDTLVIKEQETVWDTLHSYDTLYVTDTTYRVDTLYIADTAHVVDTVVSVDTLYMENYVYQGMAHDAVGYFVRIRDVMSGLRENEKVVFFIRHSERTNDTSENGELTENGKSQARELGEGLKAYGEFSFISSTFKRAAATCQFIAEGKGQGDFKLQSYADLTDSWYVKDANLLAQYKSENNNQGGWAVFSRWAFTSRYSDAFKDIDEASQELMDKYLIPGYEKMPKYTIAVSHDQLLVPFVAWATNRLVDLRYYDTKKWLNYMSGVAMVVSENGHIRYIPVYPAVTDLYSGTR